MNTYSKNDLFILDSKLNAWSVNTWHPMPVPDGIQPHALGPYGVVSSAATHWIARPPLPPCPQTKSQTDADDDNFTEWRNHDATKIYTPAAAWHAALACERARKEKP